MFLQATECLVLCLVARICASCLIICTSGEGSLDASSVAGFGTKISQAVRHPEEGRRAAHREIWKFRAAQAFIDKFANLQGVREGGEDRDRDRDRAKSKNKQKYFHLTGPGKNNTRK